MVASYGVKGQRYLFVQQCRPQDLYIILDGFHQFPISVPFLRKQPLNFMKMAYLFTKKAYLFL